MPPPQEAFAADAEGANRLNPLAAGLPVDAVDRRYPMGVGAVRAHPHLLLYMHERAPMAGGLMLAYGVFLDAVE